MAEIELSVLERQLQERIGEMEMLESAVKAWEAERNGKGASVNWQFTTEHHRRCPHQVAETLSLNRLVTEH